MFCAASDFDVRAPRPSPRPGRRVCGIRAASGVAGAVLLHRTWRLHPRDLLLAPVWACIPPLKGSEVWTFVLVYHVAEWAYEDSELGDHRIYFGLQCFLEVSPKVL